MMPSNTTQRPSDEGVERLIRDATAALEKDTPELVLDFSRVHRIDTAALRALEQLAAKARERSVKPVLRGVGVDVYKVLKLVGAGTEFSFAN